MCLSCPAGLFLIVSPWVAAWCSPEKLACEVDGLVTEDFGGLVAEDMVMVLVSVALVEDVGHGMAWPYGAVTGDFTQFGRGNRIALAWLVIRYKDL